MSQPNEILFDQNPMDLSKLKDLSSEKFFKINKIRKERRRKRRTICINTCIILEKRAENQ